MKYNELFDLEMQLANSGIKTEQYNCEGVYRSQN